MKRTAVLLSARGRWNKCVSAGCVGRTETMATLNKIVDHYIANCRPKM